MCSDIITKIGGRDYWQYLLYIYIYMYCISSNFILSNICFQTFTPKFPLASLNKVNFIPTCLFLLLFSYFNLFYIWCSFSTFSFWGVTTADHQLSWSSVLVTVSASFNILLVCSQTCCHSRSHYFQFYLSAMLPSHITTDNSLHLRTVYLPAAYIFNHTVHTSGYTHLHFLVAPSVVIQMASFNLTLCRNWVYSSVPIWDFGYVLFGEVFFFLPLK